MSGRQGECPVRDGSAHVATLRDEQGALRCECGATAHRMVRPLEVFGVFGTALGPIAGWDAVTGGAYTLPRVTR